MLPTRVGRCVSSCFRDLIPRPNTLQPEAHVKADEHAAAEHMQQREHVPIRKTNTWKQEKRRASGQRRGYTPWLQAREHGHVLWPWVLSRNGGGGRAHSSRRRAVSSNVSKKIMPPSAACGQQGDARSNKKRNTKRQRVPRRWKSRRHGTLCIATDSLQRLTYTRVSVHSCSESHCGYAPKYRICAASIVNSKHGGRAWWPSAGGSRQDGLQRLHDADGHQCVVALERRAEHDDGREVDDHHAEQQHPRHRQGQRGPVHADAHLATHRAWRSKVWDTEFGGPNDRQGPRCHGTVYHCHQTSR